MDQPHARSVSATAAAKAFGALVSRVREEQAAYTVVRDGLPVAEVSPVSSRRCSPADLAALLGQAGAVDEAFLAAVEDGVATGNRPDPPEGGWGR